MFGVIAVVSIKESEVAAFEAVAAKLVEDVKANEPGSLSYGLYKIRGVVGGYKFLEVYESKDAFKAHAKADHFLAAVPGMEATYASPMQIELLEGV